MKQSDLFRRSNQEKMSDNLEKYWADFKENGKEETFERMSSWLTYTRMKIQPKKKNTISGKIIHVVSTNKVKVAAVLGLLLLVSLGNYPVSKSKTVGYVVKFTAPVDKVEQINDHLEKLNWVDKSSITVLEKDSAGHKLYEYKILLKDSVEQDIAAKKTDIESLSAPNTVQVLPIAAAMEVPMYTVALGNIFQIDENEKIVNEKEFQQQIQNQFNNAGLNNFVFTVEPEKEGRKFRIAIPDDVVIPKDSLKNLSRMIRIEIENANKEIIKEDAKFRAQMEKFQSHQEEFRKKMERFRDFENTNSDRYNHIDINSDSSEIIIDNNGKKIIVNPDGVKILEGDKILNIPSDYNFDFNFEGMNKEEIEEMKKEIKESVKERIKIELERNQNLKEAHPEIPEVEIPEIEIPEIEDPEIEAQENEK